MKWSMAILVLICCATQGGWLSAADAGSEPGLVVRFSTDGSKLSDVAAAPNVWLYVGTGKSPTPFLPGPAVDVLVLEPKD